MYYPLKAKHNKTDNFYEFTLQDGPKRISHLEFILSAKTPSPILEYKSIRRGSDFFTRDGFRVFEGDELITDLFEELVRVVYVNGFVAQDLRGDQYALHTIGHVTSLGACTDFPDVSKHVIFRTIGGKVFSIGDIVTAQEDKLLLNRGDLPEVRYSEILQSTHVKNRWEKEQGNLYFGDTVEIRDNCFGEVCLHKGELALRIGTNYRVLDKINRRV